MITLQTLQSAIVRTRNLISTKNLSVDKLSEMSRKLDMDLMEYSRFQELKSIAGVSGELSLDAAQYVYNRIGNTVERFNKLPLEEKWVYTELFQKLLKGRIMKRIMKKSDLKEIIKEVLCELNTQNGLTIDIQRETGLLFLEKYNMGIELTSDDVDEIIKYYEKNKNNIAHSSEFAGDDDDIISEGSVSKSLFIDFARSIKALRKYERVGLDIETVPVTVDDFVGVCEEIFKKYNPNFDVAKFKDACR